MSRVDLWILPACTAALTVMFYGPLELGRDFGAFIIGLIFLLPLTVTILVISGIWLLVERRPLWLGVTRSTFFAALAPALLGPALWFFGDPLRDPARYAVWAPFHQSVLAVARRKDGVFKHWDSWGWVGGSNDSYLASDTTGSLSTPAKRDQWAKIHHLGCDLVDARRMEKGIYVVTTSECTIDSVD